MAPFEEFRVSMKPKKTTIHPYLISLGKQIKFIRIQKGLSLESLGSSIGIDGSNLQKIEKGQNITLSTLIKILIILGSEPVDFFADINWNLSKDDIDRLTIIKPTKRSKTRKR